MMIGAGVSLLNQVQRPCLIGSSCLNTKSDSITHRRSVSAVQIGKFGNTNWRSIKDKKIPHQLVINEDNKTLLRGSPIIKLRPNVTPFPFVKERTAMHDTIISCTNCPSTSESVVQMGDELRNSNSNPEKKLQVVINVDNDTLFRWKSSTEMELRPNVTCFIKEITSRYDTILYTKTDSIAYLRDVCSALDPDGLYLNNSNTYYMIDHTPRGGRCLDSSLERSRTVVIDVHGDGWEDYKENLIILLPFDADLAQKQEARRYKFPKQVPGFLTLMRILSWMDYYIIRNCLNTDVAGIMRLNFFEAYQDE